jgi:hypothetical protein
MKILFLSFLIFCQGASAADPYAFVQDFRLVSASMKGKKAYIVLHHPATLGQVQFRFIPGQACLESYPAQCYGTVLRLDDSPRAPGLRKSTLVVDMSRYFYDKGVIITIKGPKGKKVTVQY